MLGPRMTSRVSAIVLCAAALAAGVPPGSAAARQDRVGPTLAGLRDAYLHGDPGVIARSIRTTRDYAAMHRDLEGAMARWKRAWEPVDAVFLLDLVAVKFNVDVFPSDVADTIDLVNACRRFVTERPARPGLDALQDRFEVHWHHAMLALLEQRLLALVAEDYLTQVRDRIGPLTINATKRPPLLDPEIALSSAIIKEQWTTPDTVASLQHKVFEPLLLGWPLTGAVKDAYEEALRRFDLAATFPDTAAEADVRKGLLLHRTGHDADALAALDAAAKNAAQTDVLYWMRLFRGMTLDALNRPDEAATAYAAAAEAWPGAPSPAVALAALTLRQGDRDAAMHWADVVRAGSPTASDPWWQYWRGEGRLFPSLMAALRAEAAR